MILQKPVNRNYLLFVIGILGILHSAELAAQIVLPEPPELIRVTIDPEDYEVHLYWEPSPTVGITGYKVYRYEFTGLNPIPSYNEIGQTGADVTEHSFTDALINEGTVVYSVKAFIGDTASENSNLDSTIYFKEPVLDTCTACVDLSWDDYHTRRGNIDRYVISIEIDHLPFTTITVSANITDTTICNLNTKTNYKFYVSAYINSVYPDDVCTSNRKTVPVLYSRRPEYIYANFGTVVDGNPYVQFTVDPETELRDFVLFRSETPDSFTDSIATLSLTDSIIEFTDNVNASERPYYYQLAALNYCGLFIKDSLNVAGTILLNARIADNSVELNWNSYENWPGGVERYEIQRMFRGGTFETIATTGNLSFTDTEPDSDDSLHANEVCYRIVAYERPGNPYTDITASSTSVIACIQFDPAVRFINNADAFIPGDGDVGTFGPEMDFIPADFNFKIFNRWGNLVFETRDPYNPRWNGYLGNGARAPEGVYRYQIQYLNEVGQSVVIQGRVTVVVRE
jgi:hypothetical protein